MALVLCFLLLALLCGRGGLDDDLLLLFLVLFLGLTLVGLGGRLDGLLVVVCWARWVGLRRERQR